MLEGKLIFRGEREIEKLTCGWDACPQESRTLWLHTGSHLPETRAFWHREWSTQAAWYRQPLAGTDTTSHSEWKRNHLSKKQINDNDNSKILVEEIWPKIRERHRVGLQRVWPRVNRAEPCCEFGCEHLPREFCAASYNNMRSEPKVKEGKGSIHFSGTCDSFPRRWRWGGPWQQGCRRRNLCLLPRSTCLHIQARFPSKQDQYKWWKLWVQEKQRLGEKRKKRAVPETVRPFHQFQISDSSWLRPPWACCPTQGSMHSCKRGDESG